MKTMAKGLSELQKLALTLALENDAPYREAIELASDEGRITLGRDLSKPINEEWALTNPHYHDGLKHWYNVKSQELYHFYYGIEWSDYRFSGLPCQVKYSPTTSMKVAVSKAFKRLEERGLGINARGYGSGGFCLTPEGVIKAKELMAN